MYRLMYVQVGDVFFFLLFCDLEWIGENFSFAFFLTQLKLVLFVGIVTNGGLQDLAAKKK